MVRFSKIMLIAVLVASLGLHWLLLQSVAWAYMLAKYSAAASFTEAVMMTFDGQHPCQLCVLIKEGKKNEQPPINVIPKPFAKLDLFLESEPPAFMVAPSVELHFPPVNPLVPRSESPPTPPPRPV